MPRKPKYTFSAATMARLARPMPVVQIEMRTAYGANGDVRYFTEESPEFASLVRDDHDGEWLYSHVRYAGKKYRNATLTLAHDIHACSYCQSFCSKSHLVDGRCTDCRKETIRIYSRSGPDSGWRKYGEGAPYFGIELECELPKINQEEGPETFRDIVRQGEWYLPLAYTGDSSLIHGVELNTHMMTLDYLRANNHLITHTIKRLAESGAKHYGTRNGERVETSGLHVHVDITAIRTANQTLIDNWLRAHRNFLVQFSHRTEEKFQSYCEGGYKYFDKRNKERTWECRGFSSRILFEHPDALPHICAWVDTMCFVTRNPWLVFESPAAALIAAGHADTEQYIRNVLQITSIDNIPAVEQPLRDYRSFLPQAVRLHRGGVVWLYRSRPRGDAADFDVLEAHTGATLRISDGDIAEWLAKTPPPRPTLEEYRKSLIEQSEVQPCA